MTKSFSYPPHITVSNSNEVQSDEEFTFLIIDLFDKPSFDTRRRGEANDDPTKGQFTNSCGFVIEIHDSVIPELLQRIERHLEARHLENILHRDGTGLQFEHDPKAHQASMNRRNRLRVRIINDPEKAKKMTLEPLKYRKVGSLPNPVNWKTGEVTDVNEVWRSGVDRPAVDDPSECCGLPQHQAFYEILEGRISPAQDPLDDILPNFGKEANRVANDITDAVLYDRAGGYETLSIVIYLTTKTNLDLNTVKILYF